MTGQTEVPCHLCVIGMLAPKTLAIAFQSQQLLESVSGVYILLRRKGLCFPKVEGKQ